MLKIAPIHYEQPAVLSLQRPIAILLVSRGEGVLRVGSDRVTLQPGRVFLLRQESKIYLEGEVLTGHLLEFQQVLLDHYLLQNIHHQNKGLFDFGLSLAFADIRASTVFFLMNLVGQLMDELEEGSDVSIFQHYLFLFLWQVNRRVSEINVRLTHEQLVMKKVMALMETHYITRRATHFYADKLGLSNRGLNKITRAATGKLFSKLLNARVMAEADLLLRTDLPIKDIAYRMGYGSYTHFDYFCMNYLGMSAAAFRRSVLRKPSDI